MQDGFKDSVVKWLTFSLLMVIVIGGLFTARPYYLRNRALKEQMAELEIRIANKQREIAHLRENQRRFRNDPDFIEKIARQNHRVFPGELVFVFDD